VVAGSRGRDDDSSQRAGHLHGEMAGPASGSRYQHPVRGSDRQDAGDALVGCEGVDRDRRRRGAARRPTALSRQPGSHKDFIRGRFRHPQLSGPLRRFISREVETRIARCSTARSSAWLRRRRACRRL
jgi:hypothetical protein